MKTIDDIAEKKIPLVAVDKSMDRLRNKIIFNDKLDKANKVLENVDLPKDKHSK